MRKLSIKKIAATIAWSAIIFTFLILASFVIAHAVESTKEALQEPAPSYEPERDYGRTCLALVMFAEARSDGIAGMREVGRVVLRRVVDPQERFATDICGVAMDPDQFVAFRVWKPPRRPEYMDRQAWNAAQAIADELLRDGANGTDTGPCIGALYFNQTQRGSALCRVGVHYFYK